LARIAKRDLEVGVLRLQERADARVVISGEATICEVRTTLEKLSALRCDIEKRLRLKSIWRRWFWPNAEILGEQAALKFLTTINRQFEEMRGRLESGQAVSRSQLFTLFGIAGMSSDFVCSTLTALYAGQTEEQHRLKLTSQQRLAELAALRDRSIETLNKKWESIVSGVRDRIMPWVSELNKREDVVKIEAGKLGLA